MHIARTTMDSASLTVKIISLLGERIVFFKISDPYHVQSVL